MNEPILPDANRQGKICVLLIGPSSCGKTSLFVRLFNGYYRHQFQRLILFCPTVRSQENAGTYPHLMVDGIDLYIYEDYREESVTAAFEAIRQDTEERTLFVFDDVTSCQQFSRNPARKSGILADLSTRGRHRKASCIFLLHSYKSLNPTVRANVDGLVIWSLNGTELEQVRRDHTSLERSSFIKLYEHATGGSRYDFMYINIRTRKIYKNFAELSL
jgi:GTPase SAR1 family protein